MKSELTLKGRLAKSVSAIVHARLVTLLLAGLAIRFVLAPFTCHPYDLAVLYGINNDLLAGLNVYTTNSFSYPPLWPYVEYPALRLASFLVSPGIFGLRLDTLNLQVESWKLPPVVTSPLFNTVSKLPLFTADLLIGLAIYDIVKRMRGEERARLSFFLWFLNPLVISIDSIHGQFDVLPALMTVLAFCLFLRHDYFATGVAIGLGSLFKIYPVFLIPLYLFSIASFETGKSLNVSGNLSKTTVGCLKFVVGLVVTFVMFIVPLLYSNIWHDVLSRTEIIPTLGGLTFFNVSYAPGFEWLLPFIFGNGRLVSLGLIGLCFAVILFISIVCFLRRQDSLRNMVLGHISVLMVTYLTSLTVNPQYILWVLPFLVLGYGLLKHNLVKLSVLSISSLVFLISLSGPLFFTYPSAIYAHLISVDAIYANMFFFEHGSGWILLLVSGILGASVIILCLIEGLRSLLRKDDRSDVSDFSRKEETVNEESPVKSFTFHLTCPSKVLVVVMALLLIGQAIAFMQPLTTQSPVFHVNGLSSWRGEYINASYSVRSGSFPLTLQVFATPVTYFTEPVDKEILFYYDNDYPSSLVTEASWVGLLDHIPIELELGGYNGSIRIVNATELKDRMQQGHDSIVIIPSGIFPNTLHAGNETIVGDWLRAGGTMIWMGDAFAYLSGQKGRSIELFSNGNYGEIQKRILGFVLFNDTSNEDERFASGHSVFSEALDLRYPDAFTGPYVSEVLKERGLVLGKVTESGEERASIASVPVGNGYLILFGGGPGRAFTATGEDVIAHDIAHILCSGFPFSTGIAAYESLEMNRSENINGSISVTLPSGENVAGVLVVGFSKSPYVRFFFRQYCTVSNP